MAKIVKRGPNIMSKSKLRGWCPWQAQFEVPRGSLCGLFVKARHGGNTHVREKPQKHCAGNQSRLNQCLLRSGFRSSTWPMNPCLGFEYFTRRASMAIPAITFPKPPSQPHNPLILSMLSLRSIHHCGSRVTIHTTVLYFPILGNCCA